MEEINNSNELVSQVYTVADIQIILDISKNTAYEIIKQNLFPVIKVKSIYRIPKKSFHEWFDNLSNKNCVVQ